MQYIPLEYNNNSIQLFIIYNNNNNIKHSRMVLRSNGMLLSHFKRNQDAIPPHPTPPQALGGSHYHQIMKRAEGMVLQFSQCYSKHVFDLISGCNYLAVTFRMCHCVDQQKFNI
jgi:hypothetical protein